MQFAAEELLAAEGFSGLAGRVDAFEAADFTGTFGDGIGERRSGAEDVENGHSAIGEVLWFEIAGVEYDIDFHDGSVIAGEGKSGTKKSRTNI